MVESEVVFVDRRHCLYLDGVRVRGTLGGVDEFIRKALSNRFYVAEGGLPRLMSK
jgi:hypothetical protein